MVKDELTHGSLFSGIGGFDLAAKRENIKTLWNCEINEFNKKILLKNFPETKQYQDITELSNPKHVDILSGGFPCQDISVANVKGVGINGSKSGLWSEYARIIGDIKPRYVIIENSPTLLVRGFGRVLCDLSKIGYDAEWQCLQAQNFGFNHKRERLFIIAYPERYRRLFRVFDFNPSEFRKIYNSSSKKINLHSEIKKYERDGDSENIRADNGLPNRVDRIAGCGNAVIPVIAQYLFSSIKKFHSKLGEL